MSVHLEDQPPSTRQGTARYTVVYGLVSIYSKDYFLLGFGVEQLRDGTHETYWQSDGQLPHLVNICFKRKTTVSAVAVYTDFRLDESYTPSKISVRYI